MLHINTKWLLGWSDRMFQKYSHPTDDYDWCRKLAYYMGEEGNDYPSDEAIKTASRWEQNPPKNSVKELKNEL